MPFGDRATMPYRNKGRPSLSHGLDKEVNSSLLTIVDITYKHEVNQKLSQIYQIVRKIADEQQAESGKTRLTTYSVYDTIKKSNSSLNRKPKKLLEDSIERVLEVIQADLAGGDEELDSVNGDFEGLEDEKVDQVVVRYCP